MTRIHLNVPHYAMLADPYVDCGDCDRSEHTILGCGFTLDSSLKDRTSSCIVFIVLCNIFPGTMHILLINLRISLVAKSPIEQGAAMRNARHEGAPRLEH